MAALVAAAPAWGYEPSPDPYSYAMERGCKFTHRSQVARNKIRRILLNQTPFTLAEGRRVRQLTFCVATRKKARAGVRLVSKLRVWRKRHVCTTAHGNAALGRCMALRDYGWGADQFSCLDALWGGRESGWSTSAHNSSSGAHGIPQALPGWKMGPGWESDPVVQIRWGLGYIAGRYGTPCGALSHSSSTGWY